MKKNLWKKTSTYIILAGVFLGIILLELLIISIFDRMGKGECINDNVAEAVMFFICIPGIVAGIIGAIICAVRKK